MFIDSNNKVRERMQYPGFRVVKAGVTCGCQAMKWGAILQHRGVNDWSEHLYINRNTTTYTSSTARTVHYLFPSLHSLYLHIRPTKQLRLKCALSQGFSLLLHCSGAGAEIPHSRFSRSLSSNFANYILKAGICIPAAGRAGHTGCITSKTIRQPTCGVQQSSNSEDCNVIC